LPAIGFGLPQVSFDFELLDEERPLIYVSLGTVFNNNPDFFKDCMAAFQDANYQVVMSLGRRLPISALGQIPANVIVCDYVPQLEILERASLYLTHGGVNSIHQALYCGVPLIMVPQQVEHGMVAARMVELGAGLLVQKQTAEKLRKAAEAILADDSYSQNAKRLGKGLEKAGGVKTAVDRLESWPGN
jgi:MGT family glycosyltransferase